MAGNCFILNDGCIEGHCPFWVEDPELEPECMFSIIMRGMEDEMRELARYADSIAESIGIEKAQIKTLLKMLEKLFVGSSPDKVGPEAAVLVQSIFAPAIGAALQAANDFMGIVSEVEDDLPEI